jgi:hypothetical protein
VARIKLITGILFILLSFTFVTIFVVQPASLHHDSTASVAESFVSIPAIEPQESAIGSKEDPTARLDYERTMVVDPATGEIPTDIRRKEYRFAQRLPKKGRSTQLKTGETQATTWRSLGPFNFGGRTRALAIDVSDEDVILAGGVSGGMWRSEDGGDSWTKTTVPASIHSVSCIVQDQRPGKTNIWYYGTGEFTSNSASKKAAPFRGDGVFKSTDGGKTWQQLASTAEGVNNNYNSQFQYVHSLLINNGNQLDDEIFLAAVGAIFRSKDGGQSWHLALGTRVNSTPDTDLNTASISSYTEIAQASDGNYYAVLSAATLQNTSRDRGVFRSANGEDWVRITPPFWPRNDARTLIEPSSTNPNVVYFSINADSEALLKFTYLSGDGNQTRGIWQNLSDNIPAFGGRVGDYNSQSSYNMVLEVHPDNGEVVYLGGTNLYRSTDGFSSTANTDWIGGYDTTNDVSVFPNHFVDQHALAFFPSNPDRMLSSNDGGVFVTEDNTRTLPTWRSLNSGFVTAQFYTVGLDEFGSVGDVMGGLQDNGSLIANKPLDVTSWNRLLTGDGGYSAITRNSGFYYASFQYGRIYRFTLNQNKQIQTFARVDPLGSGGQGLLLFINPFVLAPENQHIMYFAGDFIWRNLNTSQIRLFKNYKTSTNWEKMSETRIEQGICTALAASYNPSGTLVYGTSHGQLFRIDQANKPEYAVVDITSPEFPSLAYVASIAIDRRNSEQVVVAFSNYNVKSLFFSRDGGDTFENISGNLEENPDGSGSGPSVRWVEIVSKNDGSSAYFAGTSTGVYSTADLSGPETEWQQEGGDVFGNVLVPMIRYFSADGTVVAATHGNGMYATQLDDVWKTEVAGNTSEFLVNSPYPNPFSSEVAIPFTIPDDGLVVATIYNAMGANIKTVVAASQFEGENVIFWDGTDDGGSYVASGTYYCKLDYNNQTMGKRLLYQP